MFSRLLHPTHHPLPLPPKTSTLFTNPHEKGLATVLSLLGLSATYAGKVMGSSGTFGGEIGSTVLPLAASAFAVAMGLNVLELVKLDLPSFEGGLDYMTSLPKNARAYLLGGSVSH